MFSFESGGHTYNIVVGEDGSIYQYCDGRLQAKAWNDGNMVCEQNYETDTTTRSAPTAGGQMQTEMTAAMAAQHIKTGYRYYINDTTHPNVTGEEAYEGYAPQRVGTADLAREIAFDVYGWSGTTYNIEGWSYY